MRLWRCARGILVDRGARTGVPESLLRHSGRAWPEGASDYWLVDERGGELARYLVIPSSLDDELAVTLYHVDGDRFWATRVSEWFGEPAPEVKAHVEIEGLVAADDTWARAAAEAASDRDAERAAERVRAGEARVAAIARARADLGAGGEVHAAQQALRGNVGSYGQAIDQALLRGLIQFAALHELAPAVAPALDAFARACRRAAFDRGLPWGDDPQPARLAAIAWSGEARAAALALVDALRRLEAELDQEAEGQEWADANLNAATFRRAAQGTAQARALLEAALAPPSPA
jgi:hypothetical protein